MPHTRSKKKKASSPAQEGKKIVVHTKRQQVLDDEGWTHVLDTPRKARVVSEKWHMGDFQIAGVGYVNKTLADLKDDWAFYHKAWDGSAADAELKTRLEEGEGKVRVRDVVVLGLGSFQSARREGRRATWTQFAALRTLLQILGKGESLQCTLQDPQFTPLDQEFLSSLDYTVVDDPAAFAQITEHSLVYAIHCYAAVYKSVSEVNAPAMLVGTDVEIFGRFTMSEQADAIAENLKNVVKGCEELDFPQVRHDFSDTKIYWRMVSGLREVKEDEAKLDNEAAPQTKSVSEEAAIESKPVDVSHITKD